jgi:ABC-type molybdate transport system substrate-binding protein
MRTPFLTLAMLAVVGPATGETIQLFAAGSLRGALTDVASAYEASSGNKVVAKFGASGLLKNEISAGAHAEVFASANMEHPQSVID